MSSSLLSTADLAALGFTAAVSIGCLATSLWKTRSANPSSSISPFAAAAAAEDAKVISIDYSLLNKVSHSASEQHQIHALIEAAFGAEGLGIIVVTNVPALASRRQELLPFARRFMRLPDSVKAKYENPQSLYSNGWSLGKEKLAGRPDTLKGSYYNNPCLDKPTQDAEAIRQYPESCSPNIWPRDGDLDGLEPAFKALGTLVADVGYLLARICDSYLRGRYGELAPLASEPLLRSSRIHKGRLLHYLPVVDKPHKDDMWCQWHYDHSLLTGLVSAAYLDERKADSEEIPCPSRQSGLFIVPSGGSSKQIVRVAIPRDGLAFQLGQTMQVLSGGALKATSHAVMGLSYDHPAAAQTSRNTFALFLEPNWDAVLQTPGWDKGVKPDLAQIGVKQFRPGQTFGEFSKRTIELYY